MKPIRIFLFLIVTLAFVVLIAWLFPVQGIVINKNFTLNFHWDFSKFADTAKAYADITEIIEINEKKIAQDSVLEIEKPLDTIRVEARQLKQKIQRIEYPAGDETLLHPFFEKLDKSQSKRTRIIHYGDSQIEGDRITGYLRNKFQRKFGGSGPGFMPVIPGLAESTSIIHKASGNWIKHAVYYKKDTILPHRQFGLLGSFARYTTYQQDSLGSDTTLHNAWVMFSKSGMAYQSVRNFTQVNMYYGHNNQSFTIKGYLNDSLIWFEMPEPTQKTQKIKWDMEQPPNTFKIEFEGAQSADIYGISLDSPKGVAVDNLPFRGSAGTDFSKLDYAQLQQMTRSLNPGLIILQFGVNVVPYKVRGYKFYENAVARQIRFLKAAMPNTPILVVGVSDMSQRKGNFYVSYPNIPSIIEAQRNAAKKTGAAFWNLFEAMGGENSMPSWVFANPPLANKDFTHFNRRGGHIVAQMLYNAIMFEYNIYGKNKTASTTVKPPA